MDQEITFIGVVHSPLKTLKDCPLQEAENAPEASIEIFPEFADGMADLEPGEEVIILSWLNQADRSVLKTKPRNAEHAKLTGVFSTRSPDRPNPVGLHIATVVSVNGHHLRVSRLEVLDGTPIVDIKPVI